MPRERYVPGGQNDEKFGCCYNKITKNGSKFIYGKVHPSIAHLVEQWTVVVLCQISIGRWFKSG